MAVPKKKTSASKRRLRNARNFVKIIRAKSYCFDDNGEVRMPHRMGKDGIYNGRQIVKRKQKSSVSAEDASYESNDLEAPQLNSSEMEIGASDEGDSNSQNDVPSDQENEDMSENARHADTSHHGEDLNQKAKNKRGSKKSDGGYDSN